MFVKIVRMLLWIICYLGFFSGLILGISIYIVVIVIMVREVFIIKVGV